MVYQEGAELGLIQIALSGTSDAAGDVEEAVATLGDEGVGVEGEPAEAKGGGERDVDGEQPGERCEKQTAGTLRCMQALVRVQARVRASRVRMSIEGQAVQNLLNVRRSKHDLLKQAEVL